MWLKLVVYFTSLKSINGFISAGYPIFEHRLTCYENQDNGSSFREWDQTTCSANFISFPLVKSCVRLRRCPLGRNASPGASNQNKTIKAWISSCMLIHRGSHGAIVPLLSISRSVTGFQGVGRGLFFTLIFTLGQVSGTNMSRAQCDSQAAWENT